VSPASLKHSCTGARVPREQQTDLFSYRKAINLAGHGVAGGVWSGRFFDIGKGGKRRAQCGKSGGTYAFAKASVFAKATTRQVGATASLTGSKGLENMCFCETNPPFCDSIFDVSNYEHWSCNGKSRKKSVGSFWKTNPFLGVFLRGLSSFRAGFG